MSQLDACAPWFEASQAPPSSRSSRDKAASRPHSDVRMLHGYPSPPHSGSSGGHGDAECCATGTRDADGDDPFLGQPSAASGQPHIAAMARQRANARYDPRYMTYVFRGQRVTYAAPPLSDSEEELVPRLLFPSGSRSKRALPRRAQAAQHPAPPPLQRTTRTRQAATSGHFVRTDQAENPAARARTIDSSLPRPNLFSQQIAARDAARSARDAATALASRPAYNLHSELHARMAAWSDDEDEEDDGAYGARVVHVDTEGDYVHRATHDLSSDEGERGPAVVRSGRPRPPTELPHWESQDVFERHVRHPDDEAHGEDARDAADEAHAKRRRVL